MILKSLNSFSFDTTLRALSDVSQHPSDLFALTGYKV